MYIVRARYWIETSRSQRTAEPIPTQAPQTHVYWIAPVQFMLQHSTVSIITGNIAIFLLSTDDALQLYFERLKGVGICMVNLVDDIHEYMRGLFFIMWVFSAAKQKVCNSADYTHCACGIINNCVCVCAGTLYRRRCWPICTFGRRGSCACSTAPTARASSCLTTRPHRIPSGECAVVVGWLARLVGSYICGRHFGVGDI